MKAYCLQRSTRSVPHDPLHQALQRQGWHLHRMRKDAGRNRPLGSHDSGGAGSGYAKTGGAQKMIPEFWSGFLAGAVLSSVVTMAAVAIALIWVWEGCRK